MRQTKTLLLIAGLVAAVALIAWYGADDVLAAFAAAGWWVVAIAAFHALPLYCDMEGWRRLFGRDGRPSGWALFGQRWASESANNLLPSAQVGGEVVRIRMAILAGVPADMAGATVLVDFTLGLVTQALFSGLGVLCLVLAIGTGGAVGPIAVAVGLFGFVVVAFIVAQRLGLIRRTGALLDRLTHRLAGASIEALAGGADRLDAAIHDLYRQPGRLARGAAWRMASWLIGTIEVWWALLLLGHPVSIAEAIAIQSLAMAARSAAFLIPGGLGVQEGGFVAVGLLLGVPAETGLALALVRRVREVLFGLPGLLFWWRAESVG